MWWRKQVELIRAARDVVELDCGEVLSVDEGEQVYRQIYKKNRADSELRTVGLFLNGKEIPARMRWGEQVGMLFNAGAEAVTFRLPPRRFGIRWKLELSTAEPELPEGDRSYAARSEVRAPRLHREASGGLPAQMHDIHLRLVGSPTLIRRVKVALLNTGHLNLLR